MKNNDLKQIIQETVKQAMNEPKSTHELRFEWLSELIEYLQEVQASDGDLSVVNKSKDLLSVKKSGDNLIFY